MAKYKTDSRDLEFTLFDVLKVDERSGDFGRQDLVEVLGQFDRFVENEIFPVRTYGDSEGVKLTSEGVIVPPSFKEPIKKFYENGWMGLGYPEDIGGMPVPHTVSFACTSMYVGANVAFSMYSGLSQGAMNVILKIGSDAQKAKCVEKMMSGEWGGTMCLTEPGAGSDVGACKSTATPIAGGKYAIKGVKIFISSGESDLYQNNIHLVLAKTPGAPEGTKGLSLFIVPRFLDDGKINNVKCTKIEEKMGIHGSATCELTFGGAGECVGELIGKEFDGMANMFIMMNEARLLCAIQGESQAALATELTLQYAKERAQFGTEIIHHPDVKRTLLRMRSLSRGMKSLVLYVADLFDRVKDDPNVEHEIALLTPVCKAYCTDEGFNVCVDAVQVHGGYGFCTEYGIEQFVRDTKIATIYEGTNGIQAIDFVLRKILKDGGKSFSALGAKIEATLKKPGCSKWAGEVALLGESLKGAMATAKIFGERAQKGQHNFVLAHATDYLAMCGNIVVAWRLLEGALVAQEKLATASPDQKGFLGSKAEDFQFFAHNFLTKNAGIARKVHEFGEFLEGVEL
jgi:hypothetical protein